MGSNINSTPVSMGVETRSKTKDIISNWNRWNINDGGPTTQQNYHNLTSINSLDKVTNSAARHSTPRPTAGCCHLADLIARSSMLKAASRRQLKLVSRNVANKRVRNVVTYMGDRKQHISAVAGNWVVQHSVKIQRVALISHSKMCWRYTTVYGFTFHCTSPIKVGKIFILNLVN